MVLTQNILMITALVFIAWGAYRIGINVFLVLKQIYLKIQLLNLKRKTELLVAELDKNRHTFPALIQKINSNRQSINKEIAFRNEAISLRTFETVRYLIISGMLVYFIGLMV